MFSRMFRNMFEAFPGSSARLFAKSRQLKLASGDTVAVLLTAKAVHSMVNATGT